MSQRFKNIIRHYKKWKTDNPDRCIEHCIKQKSLEAAIVCAALSVDANGKKHPHQYRLQKQTLESFGESLVDNIDAIRWAKNFEELISVVRDIKIYGIGELAVYDAAVRIGAFKNIWPEKIYLHAGAKVGASALMQNLNNNIMEKIELPQDFHTPDLSCYEIEDMLCIYKAMLLHARDKGKIN